jgi:hypothetical protein
MGQQGGVVDIGRVIARLAFVTHQKTAGRAFEETRRTAVHESGQVHRLGKFGPALKSAGYESLAGISVMLDAAFGEIDSQSAAAAERT